MLGESLGSGSAALGARAAGCIHDWEHALNLLSAQWDDGPTGGALALKERKPDAQVVVLYRDIRTYGFKERLYTQAREQGVLFLRYDDAHRPQVGAGDESSLTIQAWDPIVKRSILLPVSRWLFEYSRDNFLRQQRLNDVLLACIQTLAVEQVRLRREVERLRASSPGGAQSEGPRRQP